MSQAARESSSPRDVDDGTPVRDSWQAYREWLSRVDVSHARRRPDNRSVYSWQGYQSWARKVRQAMEGDS